MQKSIVPHATLREIFVRAGKDRFGEPEAFVFIATDKSPRAPLAASAELVHKAAHSFIAAASMIGPYEGMYEKSAPGRKDVRAEAAQIAQSEHREGWVTLTLAVGDLTLALQIPREELIQASRGDWQNSLIRAPGDT